MSSLTNNNFLKIDFLYFNNFNYKIKMPSTKEKMKEYRQTVNGKMSIKISEWKKSGLICDDYWDYFTIYYHWLGSTHCEKCNKEFDNTKHNDKCMDHNHITGEYRNILCLICNVNDNSKNTSGVPNVLMKRCKAKNKWVYQRIIDGKRIYKNFKTKAEAIAYKKEFESGEV